ncbi:hypothetical protein BP00DRAFT_216848 [Aspergillus indologenus CBS 114.80]|uniref:Uncharacterized protein n=1 Tax=Aspergillus indologenus CBS 114.80 TaxID=1450541 RepID=A0A2V5IG14_9EURO|nr:hypothetical protein BP00DRAFT_216848 [Aspergillus indologenus CBS 114.80]
MRPRLPRKGLGLGWLVPRRAWCETTFVVCYTFSQDLSLNLPRSTGRVRDSKTDHIPEDCPEHPFSAVSLGVKIVRSS